MNNASIIIRTKNEQALLGQCLEGIFGQDTKHAIEVLLIDSGSTDETLRIARSFPQVQVYEIEQKAFNYGRTLNMGVGLSTGEFVVPMSAHCVPVERTWLDKLVQPLIDDATLAATFCSQVPWPDCSLFERRALHAQFPNSSAQRRRWTPGASRFDVVFSNACCCIRRQRALDVPFVELEYAEDRVWATEMLVRGFGIGYVADAAVFHSHPRSTWGVYRIARKWAAAFRAMGESPPTADMGNWLRPRYVQLIWRRWMDFAKAENLSNGRWRQVLGGMVDEFMWDFGLWRSQQNDVSTGRSDGVPTRVNLPVSHEIAAS